MRSRGLCLIFVLGLAGVGRLGAQESVNPDSLPVNLRYGEREVRVEVRLTAPGHLAMFDISADDVDVVFSDQSTSLPAGPHKLALPRPRQFSGWSPLPGFRFGPCTEAVPAGLGDGIRYVYTGACGLGGRNSGNRAAAMSGQPPQPPAIVDTFLVAILPFPRGDRELRRIAGMADHEEDRADSILKALAAREEGVRWAIIVVR